MFCGKGSGKRGAFATFCFYTHRQSSAGGTGEEEENDWNYYGAVIPGYPNLDPTARDIRSFFWKLYVKERRGGIAGVVNASIERALRNPPPLRRRLRYGLRLLVMQCMPQPIGDQADGLRGEDLLVTKGGHAVVVFRHKKSRCAGLFRNLTSHSREAVAGEVFGAVTPSSSRSMNW